MAYARYPPVQSPPYDDWDQRSKTNSTSSRSPSFASSASRATSTSGYDITARTYYVELKKYLASFLAKEAKEGPSPQRVSARHKLSKLNNSQFHELAMDVYDELVRRNLGDRLVPFLSVRPDFHPKRNQARQKLATLPTLRFTDLASDVYYELTRRYPHVTDGDDMYRPPMPPLPPFTKQLSNSTNPQPSKTTQIVPVKGTIYVEKAVYSDEEESGAYSIKSMSGRHESDWPKSPGLAPNANAQKIKPQDESMDALMSDLGNMVRSPPGPSSPMHPPDIDRMRTEYENKIGSMTRRIQQLEREAQIVSDMKPPPPPHHHPPLSPGQEASNRSAVEEELRKLQERYHHLETTHKEQQQAVAKVKQETIPLLENLQRLSESNNTLRSEKEEAEKRAEKCAEELRQLQAQYQSVRTELRTIKASSLYTTELYQHDITGSEFLKPTHKGIIRIDHVTEYQTIIHELLQAARSSHPSKVIKIMQQLIVVCKAMTSDIESTENSKKLASLPQHKIDELKQKLSNSMIALLKASRNHASSQGISPASLIDGAASQVTVVLVELTQLLGMASGPDTPMLREFVH
ncbi:hypothetical protein BDF14DRAFT_1795261 [Spinellus fusiger]|nr:hypothetical protein BDF14DRAFT_1795261 [Spinellus fusiger]